jgi:hypothetical protein
MFPNNMEFMTGEHCHDLMLEADQMRVIKAAGLQQFHYQETVKQVSHWLGSQLVKFGSRLQQYGTTPMLEIPATEMMDAG